MSVEPTNDAAQSPRSTLSRRDLMRRSAVGAGTLVAVGAGGSRLAPRHSPVGRARAVPPLAIAAGGTVLAVDWLMREHDPLGWSDPAEGLTPSAFQEQAYQTALTRESNNASTFVDNKNLVEMGFPEALYGDGKLAAIESLNDEEAQSVVEDSAISAKESHETTVWTNYLKSWNESVREIKSQYQAASDHADVVADDVIGLKSFDHGTSDEYESGTTDEQWASGTDYNIQFLTQDHELPDGTTFEVETISDVDAQSFHYSPIEKYGDAQATHDICVFVDNGSERVHYLEHQSWNEIWSLFQNVSGNVNDGLVTWVGSVYGDVQAGELNTDDLLTTRELAELAPEDEEAFSQAQADLMALNISTDLDREAEIHFSDTGATVYGQLLTTSDSVTLDTGSVIDPEAEPDDYYLTYDVSEGHGEWTAYQDGVDGGVVTFLDEPFSDTLFTIHTVAGETAEATAEDFERETDDSGNEIDKWTFDISDQVENSITEVDSVDYYSQSDETRYETVRLTRQFEIVSFRDTETDEEHDSATFERDDPHDDQNYISESEWAAREQRMMQLIEDFEDSKGGGGGFSWPWEGSGVGGAAVGVVVLVGGAIAASNLLGGN